MLHLSVQNSELAPHAHWKVEWPLTPGVLHWLQAPNGVGKSTLFEEIKIQWPRLASGAELGFMDQAPLMPFQDLTVAQVFELLWDIGHLRRNGDRWQDLALWDDESRVYWGRRVNLLSGGENQWVKVIMLSALRADVWLLDEPFQNLDVRRKQQLQALLKIGLESNKLILLTHHGHELDLPVKAWQLQRTARGTIVTAGAP